jgi:hypothetical protein
MKKLLLVLALSALASTQLTAAAFLPYLEPIRQHAIDQQVVLSNNPPVNASLATALRKVRTTLERGGATNLANDVSALNSVATTVNRTSLSNSFDPHIRLALSNYVEVVIDALDASEAALLLTRPSAHQTSGDRLIDTLRVQINGAITNINTTVASKALSGVVKKLSTLASSVRKAQLARPGRDSFSAQINESHEGSFVFTPSAPRGEQALGATYSPVNGLLTISAVKANLSGRTVTSRIFSILVPSLPDSGTHTYSFGSGSGGTATALFTTGKTTGSIPPVFHYSELYQSDGGTITISHDRANKNVYGSFRIFANGQNNGGNQFSAESGTFSLTYRE